MGADIYDPDFVADLFDRCSGRYRRWSAVASFGMVGRWRRQCVAALPARTHGHGVDLMAGTGEVWPHLLRRFPNIKVTAIDISERMHKDAIERLHGTRADRITHLRANWLETDLPSASADFAISTFGLKTFNADQHNVFAAQLRRVLRPGAPYSLIEATDPVGWRLRPLYRLHLDGVLPLVEHVALRGARDFSMIGSYTRNFGAGASVIDALAREGLAPKVTRLVGGCALLLSGRAPDHAATSA